VSTGKFAPKEKGMIGTTEAPPSTKSDIHGNLKTKMAHIFQIVRVIRDELSFDFHASYQDFDASRAFVESLFVVE
jgi:hypothetical protein